LKIIIALSYFHRKIGPLIFYSYPKGGLDKELEAKIANIMDQQFNEGYFTHSFENLKSMNYYFEIHSDWARGNKEMLMVSVIVDQQFPTEFEEIISNLCIEFSEKLQSNEEIYTAFYINDLNNFEEKDKENIIKNESLIRSWLKNLYWAIMDDTREKTEEEKMAILLSNPHIFKILKKLSKGPIELEELREWFYRSFPDKNFEEAIEILVEKQIIIINQIGLVEKYVLLLKEVNAERIPPDSIIEYIDDKPELIDLLLPKVQKYFSDYEKKDDKDLTEDAFKLFKIMADPKKYNVLSELRNGLISKDKLPKLVSKKSLDSLMENIEHLKNYDIIEELTYQNERYILLKTNLQITTAFPEWMRKLLPKESNSVNVTRDISKKEKKRKKES
jgi:DNA-binding transcriptional ArsR family regulator